MADLPFDFAHGPERSRGEGPHYTWYRTATRSMHWGRRGGRGGRGEINRRLALRAHLRVAQEELSPRGRLAPALEDAAIEERPPIVVVVDVACENEAVDE